MNLRKLRKTYLCRTSIVLTAIFFAAALALANDQDRSIFVLTSTNNPSGNDVAVFKLDIGRAPSLSLVDMLPTGGKGGAGTNSGSLQFKDGLGAVANFGSNSVSQLLRYDRFIAVGPSIKLTNACVGPDSVALTEDHLFVVGTNCAESFAWPLGHRDGIVTFSDPSAGQIAAGKTWAAVTMTSGSLLQLPLTTTGSLNGSSFSVTLPSMASTVPLGEAFWGDILGFTPAHSVDSFAIVNSSRTVFPIAGPTPSFPTNAPCWVAKGPGNVWYTSNSPGHAISIFFSDAQGGVFYKSISLPGAPFDITVSKDRKWLAVIYTDNGAGYVSVFSIDHYGDLTPVATSNSVGIAAFNGVAISE